MRLIIALFSLALLAPAFAPAQETPRRQAAGNFMGTIFNPPNFSNPLLGKALHLGLTRQIEPRASSSSDDDRTCYTMRSYVFGKDGDAPRLLRETTCTPSRASLRRSNDAKVKLLPEK